MKSDSERQLAYQQRRSESEARISFWMPRESEKLANGLRKGEDMTTWVNRAITTLTYMQLLGIKFSDVISDKQAAQARKRAREEFGIELPD